MIEDTELLRQFRETRSEEAFSEIVRRYIGLVYSVAYRQVEADDQRARDVCQEVFVALARKADRFSDAVLLSGWLYRSARFTGRDAMRSERRRRVREREAQVMHEDNKEGSEQGTDWEEARPLLDDAISELHQKDRDAICLRFFQGMSFLEIGSRLQLSENASRMRVNRALDKLNALLSRNGIKSSAAALGVVLGGQIGMATPAGLSAMVAQGALASLGSVGGGTVFGMLVGIMNTSKATIGWTTLASILAVGTAVYQTNQLNAARRDLDAFPEKQDGLIGGGDALGKLRQQLLEREDVFLSLENSLKKAAEENTPAHGFSSEEIEDQLEAWVTRVDNLAEYLSQNEHLRIPEIEMLSFGKWMDVVKEGTLESEADYRLALAKLRWAAKLNAHEFIARPLVAYFKDPANDVLANSLDLLEFSDGALTAEILKRYEANPSEESLGFQPTNGKVVLIEIEQVDPVWGTRTYFSEEGNFGYRGSGISPTPMKWVSSAIDKFKEEKRRPPENSSELKPFVNKNLDTEILPEMFEALMKR